MAFKKLLRSEQREMTSAVYVENAAGWADALAQAECRRPGDYDNAMRRVSEQTGVGYSTLWGLRYRKPKRVFADIYFALGTAYEAMRLAQLKALEADIARDKAAGLGPDHTREAEAVVAAARQSSSER